MATYAAALVQMRTGRNGGWSRECLVRVTAVFYKPDESVCHRPDESCGEHSCYNALAFASAIDENR